MKRYSRYIRTAPRGNLAVAVLSDDECVNASRVNAKVFAKQIFKPCRVKHGSAAENPVRRKTADFCRRIGQNVNRVGNHQQNTVSVIFCDFGDNRFKNTDIFLYKVQPCFTGLLPCARRHDDNGSIRNIGIIAGINLHRLCKGQPVADIERLSLGSFLIPVNENHLRKQSALHQCKCTCRADITAAHYCRFS